MTHPRAQIRAAFIDRLTNATAAEERVFAGRLMPVEEPELPAIIVHTREPEKVVDRSPSSWSGFEERRCIVSVVRVAQSFENIDSDLDTMAAQVEAALQAWTIPGFESSDALLEDSDMADPEFDGSLATSALTLRIAAESLATVKNLTLTVIHSVAATTVSFDVEMRNVDLILP